MALLLFYIINWYFPLKNFQVIFVFCSPQEVGIVCTVRVRVTGNPAHGTGDTGNLRRRDTNPVLPRLPWAIANFLFLPTQSCLKMKFIRLTNSGFTRSDSTFKKRITFTLLGQNLIRSILHSVYNQRQIRKSFDNNSLIFRIEKFRRTCYCPPNVSKRA